MRIIFKLLILAAALLLVGCGGTRVISSESKTVYNDTTLSIQVPAINTTLTNYRYIPDLVIKTDSAGKVQTIGGRRYKVKSKALRGKIDVLDDGSVKVDLRQPDIKKKVRTSATTINNTLQEEKSLFKKITDFLKTTAAWVIIIVVGLIALGVIFRVSIKSLISKFM